MRRAAVNEEKQQTKEPLKHQRGKEKDHEPNNLRNSIVVRTAPKSPASFTGKQTCEQNYLLQQNK